MDIYIIICFFAVFAALVEFACINFIDTFIKRFKKWEEEQMQLEQQRREANGKEEATNGHALQVDNGDNGAALERAEEVLITIENGHHQPTQIFRVDSCVPTFAESESVSTISRQDACVSTEDDDFEDEDDDKVEAGKDDDDVWSAATVEASRCQQGRSAR